MWLRARGGAAVVWNARSPRWTRRAKFWTSRQTKEKTMNTDENEIRAVVETWAVARDSGDWESLRATWHDDGRMRTTWSDGSAVDFVEAVKRGFEAGVLVHHFLGGSQVKIIGERAVAQTKMSISQRLSLEGVEVDVTCIGRFLDFFERRGAGWRIVLREPIYEKDRMDAVVPGSFPPLDTRRLAELPAGCRHLLYCQESSGMSIRTNVPQLRGLAVDELYASAKMWMTGCALNR